MSLSSDHIPIILSYQSDDLIMNSNSSKSMMNFSKANWLSFAKELDAMVLNFPTIEHTVPGIDRAELIFRNAVRKSALHNIPSGRKNFIRHVLIIMLKY